MKEWNGNNWIDTINWSSWMCSIHQSVNFELDRKFFKNRMKCQRSNRCSNFDWTKRKRIYSQEKNTKIEWIGWHILQYMMLANIFNLITSIHWISVHFEIEFCGDSICKNFVFFVNLVCYCIDEKWHRMLVCISDGISENNERRNEN